MISIVIGLIVSAITFKSIIIAIVLALLFIVIKRKEKADLLVFFLFLFYGVFIIYFHKIIFFKEVNHLFLVIEAKNNYLVVRDLFHKYYIKISNNSYEIGDLINIKSKVKEIQMHAIVSHFDFQNYLNNQGIFYELSSSNISLIFPSLFPKRRMVNALISPYNDACKSLLKTIVFSLERDNEILKYKDSSLFLYLGLNNYLLSFLFFFIYNLLHKKTKRPNIITLFAILPYLVFILDKTITLRFILYLLVFRVLKNKQHLTFNQSVLIMLIIYLILNPLNLYVANKMIPLILLFCLNIIRKFKINKINKTLLLYLTIYVINMVNNSELTIFSPLFRTIIMSFILVFFLLSLFSVPTHLCINLLNNLANNLFNVFELFAKIDFKLYVLDNPLPKAIILLFFLLILYGFYLSHRKLIKINIFILTVSIMIFSLPIHNYYMDYLYFIDVGQGDCSLLIHQGKTLLIDTGGLLYEDLALTGLIPFFKQIHVNKIDYVICSHGDYDHMGALESLKNNFRVEKAINDKKDFPFYFLDIKIENLNNYAAHNENDSSLINKFRFMGKTFLFTGDASSVIEKQVIRDYDLSDVDVLKVGHHGSNTSSSKEFLISIKPEVAIISLGFQNKYGFPHESVLKRFEELNIKVRRTDVEGTIVYKKLSF